MALDINNASIGYSGDGIETALNNLNTRVIQDAKNLMNSKFGKLEDAVNSAWVGESAETFKKNMRTDIETISKYLDETYETLRNEMYQMVNAMAEADKNSVQLRGNV